MHPARLSAFLPTLAQVYLCVRKRWTLTSTRSSMLVSRTTAGNDQEFVARATWHWPLQAGYWLSNRRARRHASALDSQSAGRHVTAEPKTLQGAGCQGARRFESASSVDCRPGWRRGWQLSRHCAVRLLLPPAARVNALVPMLGLKQTLISAPSVQPRTRSITHCVAPAGQQIELRPRKALPLTCGI